jgi:2-polyprenyl-6-methoxyphenol hydroxylase-like FAD-dependent oxidoreductase
MSHVPSTKIVLGKRIVATTQDDTGVSCHCADSSIYHGDILIGADGAYSAVRQSLYKDLWAHGNLPRQDISPIKLDQVVVVGITEPLSPTDYPMLKEDVCQFRIVLGGHDRPYTVSVLLYLFGLFTGRFVQRWRFISQLTLPFFFYQIDLATL